MMNHLRRITSKRQNTFLTLLAALALGLVLTALAVAMLPVAETQADGPDMGYVVVVFPGEDATVRPISYTAGISRVAALRLAGWDVVAVGDTVCSIEGVGCPGATDTASCFCPDNWWANAIWNSSTGWDTSAPPFPPLANEDVVGLRWSNTAWGPPLLPAPSYTAAWKALDWLDQRQQADGGYGGPGASAETLLAVGANRLEATAWQTDNHASLFGYTTGAATAQWTDDDSLNAGAAAAGKLAVGLVGAGGPCWNQGAKRPLAYYDPASGAYSTGSAPHAWGMLGTRALSQSVPVTAVQLLKDRQFQIITIPTALDNGGWEWQPGGFGEGPDTNSTALAIQALVAAGEPVTSSAVLSGLEFLRKAQVVNGDGGFPYDPNSSLSTASDINSTAYAVQAIIAAGQNPTDVAWQNGGQTPIDFLLDNQAVDGSLPYKPGGSANQVATQQSVAALLGQGYPVAEADLADCRAWLMPVVLK